jgi:hypothetical protein
MRRLIIANSLVLAALVAGCGTGNGTTWGTPATSAANPVAIIQQAMQRSLSSTLTIEASVKAGGVSIQLSSKADPKAKVLQVSGKTPQPIEARVIGNAGYLKMDSLNRGKPWTKIDLTKLKSTSSLRQSFDLQAQTGIVGGIVTAQQAGDGRYRGTADLEKAADAAGANVTMRHSLESGAKLAKDPKAVPFEATVDAEGRLTALSYTIATDLGDFVTDVRLSGFGKPLNVTAPPAAQVEEAAAEMYAIL